MPKNSDLTKHIRAAVREMKKATTIAIVSHLNPDPDTIGSQLALAHALAGQGKRISLLNCDGVPYRCQFMPGWKRIKSSFKGKVDLAIAVDCGAPKRVGKLSSVFDDAKHTLVIDHHKEGEDFCQTRVVSHDAAATAEILVDVIKAMKVKIDKKIGTCLLSGIISDTISFHTSACTPHTMRVAADLVEDAGLDLREISDLALWRRTMPEMRLSAHSLNNLVFENEGTVCWSIVRQKDFAKHGGTMMDVEEVPNEMMGVEGVKIAVYLREREDKKYRVSLRSIPTVNVGKVAKAFNGGGHPHAAGATIGTSKSEVKALIDAVCKLNV